MSTTWSNLLCFLVPQKSIKGNSKVIKESHSHKLELFVIRIIVTTFAASSYLAWKKVLSACIKKDYLAGSIILHLDLILYTTIICNCPFE